MDRCSRPGCREELLWLKHEDTGKSAPIDPIPVFGGNIELLSSKGPNDPIDSYRVVPKDEREGRPLHRLHLLTCADPVKRRASSG